LIQVYAHTYYLLRHEEQGFKTLLHLVLRPATWLHLQSYI